MSRQRRFNNIIKVTGEQFLFMHNFNSSGGDVWYLNYVVLEHCCCYTHLHKHSNSLVPSLDAAILDQEESCPDPPPPPVQWWSDGVMEWAGLARMWLTLGPVLSLYWEQEQGQEHNNTAQSLLIIRLITAICFWESNSLPILLPT